MFAKCSLVNRREQESSTIVTINYVVKAWVRTQTQKAGHTGNPQETRLEMPHKYPNLDFDRNRPNTGVRLLAWARTQTQKAGHTGNPEEIRPINCPNFGEFFS